MKPFDRYLELIKLVNDHCTHIEQLMTLEEMFENLQVSSYLDQHEIDMLYVICRTTVNSHYGYHVYTSPSYNDPCNHVDTVIRRRSIPLED